MNKNDLIAELRAVAKYQTLAAPQYLTQHICWIAADMLASAPTREHFWRLESALSQIDYMVGEENEYGVSLYDSFRDEAAVVERVRQALGKTK